MAASNDEDCLGSSFRLSDYGLGNGRLLVHVYQHSLASRCILGLFDFARTWSNPLPSPAVGSSCV